MVCVYTCDFLTITGAHLSPLWSPAFFPPAQLASPPQATMSFFCSTLFSSCRCSIRIILPSEPTASFLSRVRDPPPAPLALAPRVLPVHPNSRAQGPWNPLPQCSLKNPVMHEENSEVRGASPLPPVHPNTDRGLTRFTSAGSVICVGVPPGRPLRCPLTSTHMPASCLGDCLPFFVTSKLH